MPRTSFVFLNDEDGLTGEEQSHAAKQEAENALQAYWNALEGTIFTERVAHGYFIMSKAAGLFVDAEKGPVLLNYGIDECRFTKPVYPGMSVGVRFTVKEKISQEKRDEEDIAKGIVKFLVDVYDDDGETVMMATILTMVRKLNQK